MKRKSPLRIATGLLLRAKSYVRDEKLGDEIDAFLRRPTGKKVDVVVPAELHQATAKSARTIKDLEAEIVRLKAMLRA